MAEGPGAGPGGVPVPIGIAGTCPGGPGVSPVRVRGPGGWAGRYERSRYRSALCTQSPGGPGAGAGHSSNTVTGTHLGPPDPVLDEVALPRHWGDPSGRYRVCPVPVTGSPVPPSPCVPQTGEAVRELLQRLRALQSERVETYRLFEEGHRAYLSSAPHYDFPRYRQLVHEVTVAFSGISREVLDIAGRLRDQLGRPDLAQHLARLQEREQEKLQLVGAGLEGSQGQSPLQLHELFFYGHPK
uniref:Required for excision 1-B domain-containing protein n=1 Tax=Catharus ustulatus TaxID=91951 RepID=A0A8C3Y2B3_CATUS